MLGAASRAFFARGGYVMVLLVHGATVRSMSVMISAIPHHEGISIGYSKPIADPSRLVSYYLVTEEKGDAQACTISHRNGIVVIGDFGRRANINRASDVQSAQWLLEQLSLGIFGHGEYKSH